ncbi:MAG: protein kinase [Acidobacteriia bacterium]|nr:protein kinase [Terriglobia bacterium]
MATPLERLQGKYEILQKLSEGGMGAVYKVRHRLLDEVRVIKVVRPQLEGKQEMRDRFFREARIAIHLRHANIAQLYDFTIDDDGVAFIVQEFIDGITLVTLLERMNPPPLALTLEIIGQSLDALGYLHRKKFVHRDVSPDNLMLTRDEDNRPRVKLIDLGIAKALTSKSSLTTAGEFVGKARYASPEQFRSTEGASVDARSDLYSLGAVMYELLTGVSPVTGDTIPSLIGAHLFEPPLPFAKSDPKGRVPAELREIVLRCLAKRPEERFRSAEELGEELTELRKTYPFAAPDLEKALALPSDATVPIPRVKPGSTQDRLDRQFRFGVTPGAGAPDAAPAESHPTPRRKTKATTDRAWRPTPLQPDPAEGAQQIAVLLAGASKLIEQGQIQEAKLQLAAVVRLDPANEPAQRLQAEVEGILAAQAKEHRCAAAEQEVEAHLLAGRLAEAREWLEEAVAELGESDSFRALGARIESEIERDQQARVAGLLGQARAAVEESRFDDGIALLEEAARIKPDDLLVREVLETTRAVREGREEEERAVRAVTATLATVDELLAEHGFRQALERLDTATEELGDRKELREARSRVEQAREEHRRREVVVDLVERANALAEDQDFAGAIELVGKARSVGVADPELVRTISETEEAVVRLEQEHRRRVVAELLESALARSAEKNFTAALALVQRAHAVGVTDPDLLRILSDSESAIKRQEAEERRQAVAERIQRARTLLAQRELAGALGVLREARDIDPEDHEVGGLMADTQAALERQEEERRRLQKLTAAAGQIEAFMEEGALREAERALGVAEKLFPGDPTFATLRLSCEELAEKRREDTLAELRLDAEALAGSGKHEQAINLVQDAAAADPGNRKLSRLLEETRRRAAEGAIEAGLMRGDLREAERALILAERLYGLHKPLRALRQRLEELKAADLDRTIS